MQEVDICPHTAHPNDIMDFCTAWETGPVWVKIDDPWSPRHGTIGQIENAKYLFEFNKLKNFPYYAASALGVRRTTTFDRVKRGDLELNIGSKKPIKIQLTRQFFKWLPDYTGPAVNAYDKNVSKNQFEIYDLLENQIKVGSFVAASGGSGMFLGTIEEIYADRKDYAITLRAKIKIMYTTPPDPDSYFERPTHSTVNVGNLIVITDTIKQQAMITKMSKLY